MDAYSFCREAADLVQRTRSVCPCIGLLAMTPSQGHGDTCLLLVACDDTARCMVAPVIE